MQLLIPILAGLGTVAGGIYIGRKSKESTPSNLFLIGAFALGVFIAATIMKGGD